MRGQTASPITVPAPSGGMNTRDAVNILPGNEGRLVQNWLSQDSGVIRRPGYTSASTGAPTATIGTLHTHLGASGEVLIGITGGDVYDFSAGTASLLSSAGYSSDYWQSASYNEWSFFVNGTDTPFRFDGSAVSATGFSGSGLTLSNLANVAFVRNRLWFCEKNSADVWYGGIASITGGLTKFPLSQQTAGGYCVAVMPWSTADAGEGADDYMAFLMSTGEVVVYSGDPASTVALVGQYKMPRPVGRRCWDLLSGEPIILTEMGLVPLTQATRGTAFDAVALGPFGKISPSIKADVATYGDNDGWGLINVKGIFYVNVPTTAGTSHQWVLNTATRAWSKYTGIPVRSMADYGGDLYFGHHSDGIVYRHTTNSDNGSTIIATARTAFVPATGGNNFNATTVKHYITSIGGVRARMALDFDFAQTPLPSHSRTVSSSTTTTPWGSPWGSPWSSTKQTTAPLYSAQGTGHAVAVALEVSGDATEINWQGSRITGNQGNFT